MNHEFKELVRYRELMLTLAWKNIAIRYKQAYLGLIWAVLKPLMLMVIFVIIRSFVGIDSGSVPYPILTFTALIPWVFFQESTTDGVNSVVQNAMLIRKIYLPREIFPLTSVLTKILDLSVNLMILAAMMIFYKIPPTIYIFWVPLILLYAVLTSLVISLIGSAINVYYRDVSSLLPVILSLLMYLSPVIYPLSLVKKVLIDQQKAGEWSDLIFTLYTINPLSGIIDGFQTAVLLGKTPNFSHTWPGFIFTGLLLPISYRLFKKSELYFADRI